MKGQSVSIIYHILYVTLFIHSINIDGAPTGRLAERQCLLLNRSCDSPDSSACFRTGMLRRGRAGGASPDELIVPERLAQDWLPGFGIQLFIATSWPFSSKMICPPAMQWSVNYTYAHRPGEWPWSDWSYSARKCCCPG